MEDYVGLVILSLLILIVILVFYVFFGDVFKEWVVSAVQGLRGLFGF